MIPIELHLTIADVKIVRLDAFLAFCALHQAKPILIELDRGTYLHQPMFTKVVSCSGRADALHVAGQYAAGLAEAGFPVCRTKAEVPASEWQQFEKECVESYFEWHGRVEMLRTKELLDLCERHQVHLSRNGLQQAPNRRFITLREYGTYPVFLQRLQDLLQELAAHQWKVEKQTAEYCIFDSRTDLDAGWLEAL